MRIACYPIAKPHKMYDMSVGGDEYDVSDVIHFDEGEGAGIGMACCPENYNDRVVDGYDGGDIERLVEIWSRSEPGVKSVYLAWIDGPHCERCVAVIAPSEWKHGDPIYFNTDTFQVEFK